MSTVVTSLGELAARLDRRTAAVARQLGDRLPLFADRAGHWTTSRRGAWIGGFWVLSLRLAAADRRLIEGTRRRLSTWRGQDTALRALIFAPAELCGRPTDDGRTVAHGLARTADDDGLIPDGPALRAPQTAPETRATVDPAAAIVWLLARHGRRAAALRHVAACERLGLLDVEQDWTRGSAWAALTLAAAARVDPERWGELATTGLDRAAATLPAGLPPARRSDPDGPRDSSAAALLALALAGLAAARDGDRERWRGDALARVRALAAEAVTAEGALLHGCYGEASDHELPWGSAALRLAIALLMRIEADR